MTQLLLYYIILQPETDKIKTNIINFHFFKSKSFLTRNTICAVDPISKWTYLSSTFRYISSLDSTFTIHSHFAWTYPILAYPRKE